MSISVLEQAKIQAQILVPLVKALQAELGEARANALVRKTLGVYARNDGVWAPSSAWFISARNPARTPCRVAGPFTI